MLPCKRLDGGFLWGDVTGYENFLNRQEFALEDPRRRGFPSASSCGGCAPVPLHQILVAKPFAAEEIQRAAHCHIHHAAPSLLDE